MCKRKMDEKACETQVQVLPHPLLIALPVL